MFFSWRIEDPNLSTFNAFQKKQINSFQEFTRLKPDSYCCVCMQVLYPEDQKFRRFSDLFSFPCLKWKLTPLSNPNDVTKKMVCLQHFKMDEEAVVTLTYPGKI